MKISEEQFQSNINKIWIYELNKIFKKANSEIFNHYHDKGKKLKLQTPNFAIHGTDKKAWGTWNINERILSVSPQLIRSMPYEAVVHVVRHEMAHMIVSELWKCGDRVSPHGETFQSACALLGIESTSCSSPSYLMKFGKTNEKIVDKVKKLMALGESPNKNESERALSKAHELMRKHNIDNLKEEREYEFTVRPIGISLGKRTPNYMYSIGRIVSDFYFVKYISSYHFDENKWVNQRHFELFGKPENLDLAEYVFHFLYNQGQELWKEFKKVKKEEGFIVRGNTLVDPDGYYTSDNYSKSAFLEGVYSGYSAKLSLGNEKQKKDFEQCENYASLNELLRTSESKLDKSYNSKYNVKYSSRSAGSASGRSDGYQKGKSLQFRSGVGSSGKTGRITG
ncbi:MAG TPA: DUF2786 domain-containing protein [Candidatus Glassbacteria bacterium]|nr:DUF2786 domain-containing protein [Candidatus Glassbacteria bacterium]